MKSVLDVYVSATGACVDLRTNDIELSCWREYNGNWENIVFRLRSSAPETVERQLKVYKSAKKKVDSILELVSADDTLDARAVFNLWAKVLGCKEFECHSQDFSVEPNVKSRPTFIRPTDAFEHCEHLVTMREERKRAASEQDQPTLN